VRRVAAALAVAAAGCGYGFSGAYRLAGGAEHVTVRTFQNRSAEPELGATVAAALRRELARQGVEGRGGDAVIDGEVSATEPVPSTPSAFTLRVILDVRARLLVGGQGRGERSIRREVDYLAGVDALETEARRALALRRAADEVAVEVLRAFER
jgi:hypothetical protein